METSSDYSYSSSTSFYSIKQRTHDFSCLFQKQLLTEFTNLRNNNVGIYKKFKNRFLSFVKKILQKFNVSLTKENKRTLKLYFIKKYFSYSSDMPDSTDLKHLYAINDSGEKLYFLKPISIGDGQNVYLGKLDDSQYILKWVSSSSKKILHEIKVLQRLFSLGADIYYFRSDFTFWGSVILCMEVLTPLDGTEDEFIVGIAVLEILKKLHTFGVHSDIKTSNIMKKNNKFYLIDYGGVSTTQYKHGFRRHTWTRKWTSQPECSRKTTISTAKNDFIELGYSMRGIQLMKNKQKLNRNNIISIKHGLLYQYMKTVEAIDETNMPQNIHNNLISILSKK